MDVRIGVTNTVKEIDIELPDDADRDAIRSSIDEALAGESKVLWLTDRNGRDIGVQASKIGYVELGSPERERRIGFGAA